jgi:phosphoribosylglycinamide formyltransferase-1
MKKIAIFASGSGTNAENIIRYFSNRKCATVSLVLSNCREALVLKRAEALNVRTYFFDRTHFYGSGSLLKVLAVHSIDLIVLAGFLWLVPKDILDNYKGRIVNIHPALLPAYGGRGMYGDRVHQAVIKNREIESGITIHHVNELYDEGDIIFQARCSIISGETPETLATKIHILEYEHYPRVIEELILTL